MLLLVIRGIFLLVAAGIGVNLAFNQELVGALHLHPVMVFGLWMVVAAAIIALDVRVRRKDISTMSAIYFGLVVGLILAYLINVALEPMILQSAGTGLAIKGVIYMILVAVLVYVCISLLLQTRNDFRFVIPYVEFAKEVKGFKPFVLDTSAIIDGRIADICETRALDNTIVVPRFVLQELQSIADSADKLRRNRGRRGLDILNRLQANKQLDIQIHDAESAEVAATKAVDHKLVLLAKELGGKVVTNDYNLNKIARIQGVDVVNLNDLANALKPVVLPGEGMSVKLIKAGEEPGQGVGYLDDGTMVVAEQGRSYIGREVQLTVTSVLQTSAGRMIFGRIAEGVPAGAGERGR